MELPHGESIAKAYNGVRRNGKLDNRGRAITVYDVLNKVIIQSNLYNYMVSERVGMVKEMQQIKENGKQKRDIVIADRGFPSLAVFIELKKLGYDFVIRYNGEQFLKEFSEFPKSKDAETIVTIDPLIPYNRKIKRKKIVKEMPDLSYGNIKLRLVKAVLDNGEIEYLVTSILDCGELTKQDIKNIYGLRWEIEESFKYQKSKIKT